MLHIIKGFKGKDKKGHYHYDTLCSISVATEAPLPKPKKGGPATVEVSDNIGSVLCKTCDEGQYNIQSKITPFMAGAAKSGFMRSKPDGDAVGKEEAVVIEGYGIDGELSSDDGLGAYES